MVCIFTFRCPIFFATPDPKSTHHIARSLIRRVSVSSRSCPLGGGARAKSQCCENGAGKPDTKGMEGSPPPRGDTSTGTADAIFSRTENEHVLPEAPSAWKCKSPPVFLSLFPLVVHRDAPPPAGPVDRRCDGGWPIFSPILPVLPSLLRFLSNNATLKMTSIKAILDSVKGKSKGMWGCSSERLNGPCQNEPE